MSAIPLHDVEVVGGGPLLVPPGDYQAVYLHHETAITFTTPKCYVHFKLYGGEFNGAQLYRAYRVHQLRGKPRKNGAFKVRHSHDLYRELTGLSGKSERPDRLSLARLKGCLLTVRVRTVTKDARQQALPEAARYSVVGAMLRLDAGSIKES